MTDPQDFDTKQIDPHARRRSLGRELAMKLLYLLDVRGQADTDSDLSRVLSREKEHKDSEVFALELYHGIAEKVAELDERIQKTAANWEIGRMACVDRALLRLGTYELLYRPDVPPKVSISEAIELAKKYSTEKSSSFVNGILDRIYQDYCPEKA